MPYVTDAVEIAQHKAHRLYIEECNAETNRKAAEVDRLRAEIAALKQTTR